MNKPLHIILPTDVFPPKAGGAGWSTHALARALQARGHTVQAFVPQRGLHGLHQRVEAGVPVIDVGYQHSAWPFVANYGRFERFWPQFAQAIIDHIHHIQAEHVIIHAQHTQGVGAAVLASQHVDVPVLATVRDHWPWHYFATGLHADRMPVERFAWAHAATDLIGRNRPLIGVLSLLGLPYMQAHMRRRQALLQQCAAVIGVSPYIVDRLRSIVVPERLYAVPNMVDLEQIDQIIAEPSQLVIPDDFILFAGKLARNKGAYLLPEVMHSLQQTGFNPTLVIVGGNNPELLAQLQQHHVSVIAVEWAQHDDVLRLMARCRALVFPSTWGEPLSRVLLEACAVGTPIAAIPTGGTPDLLTHEQNALFAATAQQLGQQVGRLLADQTLARRLAAQARLLAEQRLSSQLVVQRLEHIYTHLQNTHR